MLFLLRFAWGKIRITLSVVFENLSFYFSQFSFMNCEYSGAMKNNVVAVIPARYHSQRLPGKPLVRLNNRPLILHVLERAKSIPSVDLVIVATDDKRVADVVKQDGGMAVMTPPELPSGSDRVGWIVKNMDCEIVVNLQGDEPLIDTTSIQNGIDMMLRKTELKVISLGYPLIQEEDWMDPNIVKVLTDEFNNAIYFSRQAIPFFRDRKFSPLTCLFQHIGVYIYRKDFLLEFLNWEIPAIENAEKLEQLRILFKGVQIKIVESNSPSVGVDLPSDIEIVEKLLKERDRN